MLKALMEVKGALCTGDDALLARSFRLIYNMHSIVQDDGSYVSERI